MPGRIETVKSGAMIFFTSSSTITSLAMCLGGTILHPLESVLHFSDPTLEPGRQGFVGQSRADDCCDNLVQVGQALDRVGEGLLIELGVFRPDPITDGAVGNGGKFKCHRNSVRDAAAVRGSCEHQVAQPSSRQQNWLSFSCCDWPLCRWYEKYHME